MTMTNNTESTGMSGSESAGQWRPAIEKYGVGKFELIIIHLLVVPLPLPGVGRPDHVTYLQDYLIALPPMLRFKPIQIDNITNTCLGQAK